MGEKFYKRNEKSHNLLLINPPSGFLLDEKVFLPLGIAGIASTAIERGHNVKLLDLTSDQDYQKIVLDEIWNNSYDAVGITGTSPQFYYAYRINKAIKKQYPDIKTIIGGSHASMFSSLRKQLIQRFSSKNNGKSIEERLYEEDPNFSRLEEFDVIAEGEENSIFAALNSDNGKWVDGGIIHDVDSVPMPARDLFDFKSYLLDPQGTPKFKIGGKASGSIISQRGCPYGCEFCCGRDSDMYHTVKFKDSDGKSKWRTHSKDRILKELDYMNNHFGLESFMFYDDEFNLNPDRTIELCQVLSSRNYSFRGFVKSDLAVKHPEVIKSMKEAGFAEVLTGIESGSDRILGRHLHKKTSPEINYRAAEILLENGIGLKALTMLGHTSESEEDIMKTRDWLLKVGKMFKNKLGSGYFTFDLTVFQPYAGCPIWDRAEKNTGEFLEQYKWVYKTKFKGEQVDPEYGGIYFNKVDFSTEHGFYKGIPGEYKAFIRTKHVPAERFVYLRDQIEYDIRNELGMPQLPHLMKITSRSQFEHSMGQRG